MTRRLFTNLTVRSIGEIPHVPKTGISLTKITNAAHNSASASRHLLGISPPYEESASGKFSLAFLREISHR